MDHVQETNSPDETARPTRVDLSQLALERSEPTTSTIQRRRPWLTRYVLPLGILLAFVSLLAWAARESFLPSQPVTVVPVLVARADVQQEGTPLFQAAGWIEPRPTPTVVSSLATGVIDQLRVVEGQSVKQGDVIATLIDVDARLALQKADAEYQLREAETAQAEAMLAAAKVKLANPTQAQAALADAQALLAKVNLELVNLPFALQAAETRRELAQYTVTRKQQAGDAVPGRVLREAEAELAAASNAVKQLQARKPILESQRDALANKSEAQSQQLELMADERRDVAESQAKLQAARARTAQAQVAVDAARLQLERMVITAPMAGRVLRLLASPGKRLTGIDPHSEQGSSAVMSMYDPSQLQVRVDVRLEDVPHVQLGQEVRIQTASMSKMLTGKVIWVTTFADIQKNTLQVKVAIDSPPEVIKPEMLAQATFLALPVVGQKEEGENSPLRTLVPRSLVVAGEGGNYLWVANLETHTACRQSVQLGLAGTDELVEVAQGISPMDKLIVAGREILSEGDRIQITGEK